MATLITLVNGTVPVAADFNTSYTNLNNEVRPVATGGTALSTVPTNGQLLIGNGTGYTLAALTAGARMIVTNGVGSITLVADPIVEFTATTNVVYGASTTETTIFTGTLTGGRLSTANQVQTRLLCQVTNNTGGAETLTVRCNYGGSTIATVTRSIANGTNAGALLIQYFLSADGATNAQVGIATVRHPTLASLARGTLAIDSTVNQTLAVTAQWATNSADLTMTMEYGAAVSMR